MEATISAASVSCSAFLLRETIWNNMEKAEGQAAVEDNKDESPFLYPF